MVTKFLQIFLDCYETNEDCHEPLKHCVNCWDDPTTELCKKDCIVGPGPCINENKIKVGNCIEGKKLALARADKCLVCAEACGMDQNTVSQKTTTQKIYRFDHSDLQYSAYIRNPNPKNENGF